VCLKNKKAKKKTEKENNDSDSGSDADQSIISGSDVSSLLENMAENRTKSKLKDDNKPVDKFSFHFSYNFGAYDTIDSDMVFSGLSENYLELEKENGNVYMKKFNGGSLALYLKSDKNHVFDIFDLVQKVL